MAARWQETEVVSPHVQHPVKVIAAKDVPYVAKGNRLQTLNIYIPASNSSFEGRSVDSLPGNPSASQFPRFQVHVHGGAWRDPRLLASSIEAAVAHAFSANDSAHQLDAVISLNYTLASFPKHPTEPYEPTKNKHSDPAREGVHPRHIQDVLHAFAFLKSIGLTDDSFILTGHSAGSCLAFQAALFNAEYWQPDGSVGEIPRPAALLGMNGLYGLPELVYGLGDHASLKETYADLLGIAFGPESGFEAASPAHVDEKALAERVKRGRGPKLVMVDQSRQDQLVPVNQMEQMKRKLESIDGLKVVEGKRCTGTHASPWEQGYMIWENIKDVLDLLSA